jgi:uncharacterized alkaline shock family protein YloU
VADGSTTVGTALVGPRAPADQRGRLEVRDKVLRRLAEHASLQTPGTTSHEPTLGRLRGATLPRAEVVRRGRTARVVIDVACGWPAPVARIAAEVREHVRAETARLSGVPITRVDVTAHAVVGSDDPRAGRRVE